MITRDTIEGRPATVAYINDRFEPVSADDATMVKVIFDDGEVRFGIKSEKDKRKSPVAAREASRAGAVEGLIECSLVTATKLDRCLIEPTI